MKWWRPQWGEIAGLLLIYGVLVVVLASSSPYFLSPSNFVSILQASSVIGIIAGASTAVIIAGGLDLSIGGVVALAGVALAGLSQHTSIGNAIGGALLLGAAIGLGNGLAVTQLRVNPFIATLAMLSITRGFAFIFTGALTQTIHDPWFASLRSATVGGLPYQVVAMLVMLAGFIWLMRYTVLGRYLYAIGGNLNASRLSGLPVGKTQLAVYTLSGFSAAVGGIALAAQFGAAAPQAANGIELSVIAAVILGGTSLSGGKGGIGGTVLGVLILGTLNNGLTLMNVSSDYQDVARGGVLLLAVGLDQLRLRLIGGRS